MLLALEELDGPQNPQAIAQPDGSVRIFLEYEHRLGFAVVDESSHVHITRCQHQTPKVCKSHRTTSHQTGHVARLRDLFGWVRGDNYWGADAMPVIQ